MNNEREAIENAMSRVLGEDRSKGWAAVPDNAPAWVKKRVLEIRLARLAGRETRSITATPATRGPYLYVAHVKPETRTAKPILTAEDKVQLKRLIKTVSAEKTARRRNLINTVL